MSLTCSSAARNLCWTCYENIDRHLRATGAPVRIWILFARIRQRGGFLYNIHALARSQGLDWNVAVPSNDWQIVHFFGFDNSFYHALLYLALYAEVFSHWRPRIRCHVNEFYLLDGKKFSSSRCHAVWGQGGSEPKDGPCRAPPFGLGTPGR
ncbi:class I tRNA ligase family protein [Mesorhizobium australicum]|uniref:class I tRNA ligase family protein n=1 Tax=Mesorhizobium australicum TaxID=536018 RepID=UPI003336CE82